MNIVKAIKSIMKEEGITQKEMAERMGIQGGASGVSGRLGRSSLSVKSVCRFVEALPEWELVLRRKDGTSEKVITDVE